MRLVYRISQVGFLILGLASLFVRDDSATSIACCAFSLASSAKADLEDR